MSTIIYLNEFVWRFDPARSSRNAPAGAGDGVEDVVDVICRFPSFSVFVDQLIADLTAAGVADQRAAELAELEEERLLLARLATG